MLMFINLPQFNWEAVPDAAVGLTRAISVTQFLWNLPYMPHNKSFSAASRPDGYIVPTWRLKRCEQLPPAADGGSSYAVWIKGPTRDMAAQINVLWNLSETISNFQSLAMGNVFLWVREEGSENWVEPSLLGSEPMPIVLRYVEDTVTAKYPSAPNSGAEGA